MTKREQLLCEATHHITIESSWMEEAEYIYVEDSDTFTGVVLKIAEEYVNEHPEGDEEDYLGTIIPYAQRRLYEELGKCENDQRHNELVEAALFGDKIHMSAAQYALKNDVSLLDYDCWTHAMEVMEYQVSYDEYRQLNANIAMDFMELDITEAPALLRCLLEIRRRIK